MERVQVDPATNCWLWAGGVFADGYGRVKFGGKTWRVHRLFFSLYKERIPEDKIILHSCDTPLCVNPEHLRLGTALDNRRDCISKGRHFAVNQKRLTLLKEVYQTCKNYNEVARIFRLNSGTVWHLLNWRKPS